MKTIHILRQPKKKQQELIKELYQKFLYKDKLWHFFLEPDLIIRCTNRKVIQDIATYLHWKFVPFDIYDYPHSKNSVNIGGWDYDEAPKSITVKYLKHFMQVYHVQCVFYMEIEEKDKPMMRAKLIHSLWNQDFKNYEDEMQGLNSLALRRAMIIGSMGRKE